MKNHIKPGTPTAAVRRQPASNRRPLGNDWMIARAHIRFLQIVLGRPPSLSGWEKKSA
jgi:hypothetical protein